VHSTTAFAQPLHFGSDLSHYLTCETDILLYEGDPDLDLTPTASLVCWKLIMVHCWCTTVILRR